MAQKTNLNISPYFDDFNKNKNFYKVLFNPGKPIQSRELNTVQSILQDQIESFGSHIFKEGSVVIPGNVFYDSQYYAVKLNSTNFGIDISSYINSFIGKKIIGETSGVTATIQGVEFPNNATDVEYITLYVNYLDSDNDFKFSFFADGESLTCEVDVTYGNTTINSGEIFAKLIDLEATSIGSSASIDEGVYFVRGSFVRVNKETIVLDYYTNTPSYRIGLKVSEEIITAKDDPSLYDNAKGFNNYAAPGADRFKISLSLTKKSLDDTNDIDFIELLRVENGGLKKLQPKTQYNLIRDYIAQRTYDESGDYVVNPFQISLNNSLNNRIGNDGIFLPTEKTQQNNTPNDDLMCVKISPGKAYVRGYDIEKTETTIIDVDKPRDTQKVESTNIPFEMGNLIRVNNVSGSPILRNKIELRNKRRGSSSIKTIGSARVYNFNLTDAAYLDASTNWDLYLFDIQTYTELVLNESITTSDLPKSSFVKGKSSGASGYVVSAPGAAPGSTTIQLSQTSGSFFVGEQILINGIETASRTITSINVYSIEDIKSVYQDNTIDFNADTVLEFETNLTEVTINGTNVTAPGNAFSQVKPNSIIVYTKVGATLPTYNLIKEITGNGTGLVLEALTSVSEVNDGTLSGSAIQTNFILGNTKIRNQNSSYLYAKLPNVNVASVDLSSSSIIFTAQTLSSFSKTPLSSGAKSITIVISDFNLPAGVNDALFAPFDEERYSVFYDDGTIFNLTPDKISINSTSTSITISGLNSSKSVRVINATFIKPKVQSKVKIYNRCKKLEVSLSKYEKSGSNENNSVKDGLTYNSYYGLRVQDEEISLNYPDASKLIKVYESLDENSAILDQIILPSTINVQVNAIIGENIIGSTSNCTAKVVGKPAGSPNNLEVVYLNENKFITGELVSFEESNLSDKIISSISGKYKDVTNNFSLDKSQKNEYYDYSKIIRSASSAEPSKKLLVIFDYYSVPSNDSGDLYTVLSYDKERFLSDIPSIGTNLDRASDTLDFRPRVSPFTVTNSSPFDIDSRNFGSDPKLLLTPNEGCVLGYNYYVPRIDKIYLDKLGNFVVEKGVPSPKPKPPYKNDQVLELATINLPAYLYNPKEAIITLVDNRRYTMRDIGKIETRVDNLERVTSLSLLEVNTQTLQIQDGQRLNRFKTGIFVDDFKNNNLINLDLSLVEVDANAKELTPIISKDTLKTQLLPASNLSIESVDYSTNYKLLDSNVQKTGDLITLKYEEKEWIKQTQATKLCNVNPFEVVEYVGYIKLTPDSDSWVRTLILPDNIITNSDSEIVFQDTTTKKVSRKKFKKLKKKLNKDKEYRASFDSVEITKKKITTVDSEEDVSIEESSKTELVSSSQEEFMRSRNTQFFVNALKPLTRYYQFLDGNSSVDFVPKLVEISSDTSLQNYGASKGFTIGETVSGYFDNSEIITFRLAQPNHKTGKFDSPDQVFNVNPYVKNEALPTQYSASSKVLNIDTFALTDESQGLYSGFLQIGTKLVGQSSGAVAFVKDLRLISDNYGDLIGTFFLKDPYSDPTPSVRISTGTKNYKLSNSSANETPPPGDTLASSAETTYTAQGTLELYQTTITRNITTKVSIDIDIVKKRKKKKKACRVDPLAQSFTVGGNIEDSRPGEAGSDDKNGAFLSSVDLYFGTKDTGNNPVTVEIRTTNFGSPTLSILGNPVTLRPDQINVSDDGTVPTRFTFDYPIYLEPGEQYAVVILAPQSLLYQVWVAEMNKKTVGTSDLPDANSGVYGRNFSLGQLYKSQNGAEWVPSPYEDLKFKLYKCNFTSNTGTAYFTNPKLDKSNGFIKTLPPNSITVYPRKLKVKVTAISNPALTIGRKVTSAQLPYNYGIIENIGGSATSVGVAFSGSNYVTSTNVDTYPISGNGTGLKLDITALNGVITNAVINISSSSSGYTVGDIVGIVTSSTVSKTGQNGVVSISSISSKDTLYLTNVQGNTFETNANNTLSYYDDNGSIVADTIEILDSTPIGGIYEGNVIKVDHGNHGMYAKNNKLTISNVETNIIPTELTTPLSITDISVVSVANTSNFAIFEGIAVGSQNPGYIKINEEIIKYTGVNNTALTGIERGKDNTFPTEHPLNSLVYKYELNGISLRRINKDHDIKDTGIDLDYYYVDIDRDGTLATDGNTDRETDKDSSGGIQPINSPLMSFTNEISAGGNAILVTENILYSKVIPYYDSFTPGSATEISAKIRTISGTSSSGSEVSFNDLGYEQVQLNSLNTLSSVRLVCSKINEDTYINSIDRKKSFTTALTLSTKDPNLSPYLFVDNCFTEFQVARLNSPISDYVSDNRVNSIIDDPHAMIYVSNTVSLSQSATSLKVLLSAYRHSSADFRVLYSLIRPDSSEVDQVFELFPGYDNLTIDNNQDGFLDVVDSSRNSGLPDTYVAPSLSNQFLDYEFTASNLGFFTGFTIKIVASGTNQAFYPRFKDIRSIATV